MDPQAAAAAWIAELPAAARAASGPGTTWTEALGVGQLLVFLVLCGVLLRTGVPARLGASAQARGFSQWITDAGSAFVFGVLAILAAAPLTALSSWRSEPARWLRALLDASLGDLLLVLLAALPAAAALLLIRRAPKAWGLILGGVLGALAFAALWLPYHQASGPAALPGAPRGPARAGLIQLLHETRVPASDVYISANPGIDADVTGTGQSAQVVISRGFWTKASPEELRASVGHLIGHYRHHDQLSLALLLAGLTLGAFAGLQLLAPPLARRLGFDGPGDPAALPLLAMLFVLLASASAVIERGFDRAINVRADQFSLDHAKEPDGLALALLREWKGERVDPSPLEEAIFYDHPSLKSRLVHAMSWKAAHSG